MIRINAYFIATGAAVLGGLAVTPAGAAHPHRNNWAT